MIYLDSVQTKSTFSEYFLNLFLPFLRISWVCFADIMLFNVFFPSCTSCHTVSCLYLGSLERFVIAEVLLNTTHTHFWAEFISKLKWMLYAIFICIHMLCRRLSVIFLVIEVYGTLWCFHCKCFTSRKVDGKNLNGSSLVLDASHSVCLWCLMRLYFQILCI